MSYRASDTDLPLPEAPIGTSEKVRRLWEMRVTFATTKQVRAALAGLERRIARLERKVAGRKAE